MCVQYECARKLEEITTAGYSPYNLVGSRGTMYASLGNVLYGMLLHFPYVNVMLVGDMYRQRVVQYVV